jgi:hypothetical protein
MLFREKLPLMLENTAATALSPLAQIAAALINTVFVEEIHPWTTVEYVLRIKGGKESHASRAFKKSLHSVSSLWLGTGGFTAGCKLHVLRNRLDPKKGVE